MAQTPSSSRYVTSHDPSGASIFLHEGPMPTFETERNGLKTAHGVPWSTGSPPNLSDDTDTQQTAFSSIHTGEGTTARFLTIPPGARGVMHRTATLDYVVIQKGEIVLELEGGGERLLKEGDVVVQRGTNEQQWGDGELARLIGPAPVLQLGDDVVCSKRRGQFSPESQ